MTLKNTLPSKRRDMAETEQAITLPALLSEREAAAYTGASVAFLRRCRSEGATGQRTPGPLFVRLASFGTGRGRNAGRVMYPRCELDAWLKSLALQRTI